MQTLKRYALGVVVALAATIVCAGLWLLVPFAKGTRADKLQMLVNLFGFADPALLAILREDGSLVHRLSKYLVDWVTAYPQRAAKFGAFMLALHLVLIARPWRLAPDIFALFA